MESDSPFPFDGGSLRLADVQATAVDLLASEEIEKDGRAARTLAKSPGLTVVLTAIRAGGEIREHAAPGPVTIVPVLGKPSFWGPGPQQGIELSPGQVLFIARGQKHHVKAAADCAFLIVIGSQQG